MLNNSQSSLEIPHIRWAIKFIDAVYPPKQIVMEHFRPRTSIVIFYDFVFWVLFIDCVISLEDRVQVGNGHFVIAFVWCVTVNKCESNNALVD